MILQKYISIQRDQIRQFGLPHAATLNSHAIAKLTDAGKTYLRGSMPRNILSESIHYLRNSWAIAQST